MLALLYTRAPEKSMNQKRKRFLAESRSQSRGIFLHTPAHRSRKDRSGKAESEESEEVTSQLCSSVNRKSSIPFIFPFRIRKMGKILWLPTLLNNSDRLLISRTEY